MTEHCPVGEFPVSVQIVLAGIQREDDGLGELVAVKGKAVVVRRIDGGLLDDGDGANLRLLERAYVVGIARGPGIAALIGVQVGVASVDGRAASQQGVGPGWAAVVTPLAEQWRPTDDCAVVAVRKATATLRFHQVMAAIRHGVRK